MKKKRRIRSRIKDIRVSFQNKQTSLGSILNVLLELSALVLIPSGFLLILGGLSDHISRYLNINILVLTLLSIFYLITVKLFKKQSKYLVLIFLTLPLVVLLLFPAVLNQFFLVINDVLKSVGQLRGAYLFDLAASNTEVGAVIFTSCLGMFLLAISIGMIRYEKVSLFLMWLMILVLSIFLKGQISLMSLLCLLFATLIILYLSTLNTKHLVQTKGSSFISLSLLVGMVLTFSLSHAFGVDGFNQSVKSVDNLQTNLSNKGKQMRYAQGKNTPLTRGKVTQVKTVATDTPILEVEMSTPESMYLKNYVGSDYNAGVWSELSSEDLYDNYGMMYWLGEHDFTSFSQLSDLARLNEELKPVHVVVNNIGESSETLFVPYGMMNSKGVSKLVSNDAMLFSQGILGDRKMSFDVMSQATTQYPFLVGEFATLESRSDKQEVSDYLVSESNYNDYVYQHYLSVPKQLGTEISMLTNQGKDVSQRAFYEEADQIIKDYFAKESLTDKEVTPIPSDFISQSIDHKYQLQTPQEYATMGTLMYRQLGIPARYVEGYLVTPEDVKEAKKSKMTITSKNAHAWTEVYQDGVGWVPKEVMSSTENIMPQPTFTSLPYTGDGSRDKDKQTQALPHEPEKINDSESSKQPVTLQKETSVKPLLLKGLLVLLSLLILGALIFIVIKLNQCYRLKKEQQALFNQEDNFLAAQALYQDLVNLLVLDGTNLTFYDLEQDISLLEEKYGADYSEFYKRVVIYLENTLYAGDDFSNKQLERVHQCHELTSHYVLDRKSSKQRRQMRRELLNTFSQKS